ncbi:MAG: sigma-70 family RNA polymerase sigma factor [Desulfobacteraceae bacterium]|nr:sigma-70 family RNA polymerase sigma factor [Desulfobacteraceae bacterium]
MTETPNPPKIDDPDHDLIVAIQEGSPSLFTDLVQRYGKPLYNFGLKMCGKSDTAEDLVQETFLNAFRYLGSFRRETKFKNWLYRIATSVCIKNRRKSKFAPERELSLEEFLPADEAAVEREVPSWAALPIDQVLDEELKQHLQASILALPEKYRAVLLLRDIEGFSTEEAGQMLNLTPANVKVRLHRARLFLKDRLKGYFENE